MPKGQKIQSIIEKHELEGLGDELVDLWTDPENAKSLHELESYVNQQIVQSVINEQVGGLVPQTQSPESIARTLQADGSEAERFESVSQVQITEVRNWLDEQNIDADDLSSDFVSYNTVYHYLTDIRDANASEDRQKSTTPGERQDKVITRLSNLSQRIEAVVKQALESLVNADIIPNSYDVRLEFRIECTECDRRQNLLGYIRNRGCSSCTANMRDQE